MFQTRRASTRRWLSLALAATLFGSTAYAQEPTPATAQPPVLPPTEVIGEAPNVEAGPFDNDDAYFNQSPLVGPFFAAPVVGYRAPSSTAGTIIDVPLLEYPGTIDPITRDTIDDQKALRIDEILRNTAGAQPLYDPNRGDSFLLRGFELRSTNFRKNGFLDTTATPRDFANVERIDVLKGPASVIYGAGQPSGVVNVVTKKPLYSQFAHGDATLGSWDLQRYQADVNGFVNEDGTILYRLNGAYENRNGFRDFYYNEREFFSPVVTWEMNERTTLTFEAEYLHDRRRADTGVVAINGDPLALPNNRFLGEPTDFAEYHDYRAQLFLTHEINDYWTLYMGGSTLFYDQETSTTAPVAFTDVGGFAPPTTLARVRNDVVDSHEENHSLIANVAGEWSGPVFDHKTVVGTEQVWFIADGFQGNFSNPATSPLLIDPLNPQYNNPAFLGFIPTGLPDPAVASTFNTSYRQNRHGVYAQDIVSVNEYIDVLAGVRFDVADVTFQRDLTFIIPPTRTETEYQRTSPRVGIVLYPLQDKNVSVYGLYSLSFDPPPGGARITTNALEAETGETVEGGVKAEVVDGLTVVMSAFWINKENVTVDSPVVDNFGIPVPPFFATSQVGRQRSQGMEFSAVGQISDPWSIIANYAYVDTYSEDTVNLQFNNKSIRGVPLHSGSLWSRYNLLQDETRTFGVALGMVAMSNRLGDYNQPLNLPGFGRFDAGAYYQRGRWDTSLYVENIFDKEYISNSTSTFQVYPGAPVNFRAMVGVTF